MERSAKAKKRAAETIDHKKTRAELPVLTFASARAWCAWLASNHTLSSGIWLKIAKKASAHASVTYAEALESALVWGWIDGQKGAVDEAWWRQRFTPRGARSPWSKINRAKAEALIAAGEMKPPGLGEGERACGAVLRHAQNPQSLRRPLPGGECEEGGHARRSHREVRGHARTRREAASLSRAPLSVEWPEGLRPVLRFHLCVFVSTFTSEDSSSSLPFPAAPGPS